VLATTAAAQQQQRNSTPSSQHLHSMSNAGVATWTAVIKELQQLLNASDEASTTAAINALYARLNSLVADQQLPHAALKKLVQDVQVSWGMHGPHPLSQSSMVQGSCRTYAGHRKAVLACCSHFNHVAVTSTMPAGA
jgi:hypothetical protein